MQNESRSISLNKIPRTLQRDASKIINIEPRYVKTSKRISGTVTGDYLDLFKKKFATCPRKIPTLSN